MQKIVVLNDADNVATCLTDLDADARIEIKVAGEMRSVTLREPVDRSRLDG